MGSRREEELRHTVAVADVNKTFRPLLNVLLDQYRVWREFSVFTTIYCEKLSFIDIFIFFDIPERLINHVSLFI